MPIIQPLDDGRVLFIWTPSHKNENLLKSYVLDLNVGHKSRLSDICMNYLCDNIDTFDIQTNRKILSMPTHIINQICEKVSILFILIQVNII